MIPLIIRLKRQVHRDVAKAQDLIVAALYSVFHDAVLHGGTAIWRCYQGNRFSEDIDTYLSRDLTKIQQFFTHLEKQGFGIEKKKIGERSIYSQLRFDRTVVRFEAIFKKIDGHLKEYETVEGNIITVYTLTPKEFIEEKIAAYLNRRKIRDLYDIFFLLRHVSGASSLQTKLQNFFQKFQQPVDEEDLQILILEGLVPTTEKMREYIQRKI